MNKIESQTHTKIAELITGSQVDTRCHYFAVLAYHDHEPSLVVVELKWCSKGHYFERIAEAKTQFAGHERENESYLPLIKALAPYESWAKKWEATAWEDENDWPNEVSREMVEAL